MQKVKSHRRGGKSVSGYSRKGKKAGGKVASTGFKEYKKEQSREVEVEYAGARVKRGKRSDYGEE